MEFKQIIERAKEIREKYAELELKKYGKSWNRENHVQGLIGDVGDLMKLVMVKQGIRKIDDVDNKLKHELADCLWSILVIANEYNIDMEKAFLETMNELEENISSEKNS